MVNNNGIPFEVKKPVETVYEIKNEIPSFEEFMKEYKVDESLNYDDLKGGSVGEVKGYGPCIINGKLNYDNCHCPDEELDRQYKIIRNKVELDKIENSPANRQFYLEISVNDDSYFWTLDHSYSGWKLARDVGTGFVTAMFTLGIGTVERDYFWGHSVKFSSAREANEFAGRLERGGVLISTSHSGLESWVISTIRSAVSNYESGNSVNMSTHW